MSEYGQYPPAPPIDMSAGSGVRLAGWWRRVGATLVDGILTGVIGGVLALLIGGSSRYWLGALIGLVYTVALLGSRSRTVGNLAAGTMVVPADGGPAPIGYGKAFLRWLVQGLLGITIIGGILDVLWPLWDERNQTLHDKAVSTLVVMV